MSAFCLINQLKIDFLFSKVRMPRTFKDINLSLRLLRSMVRSVINNRTIAFIPEKAEVRQNNICLNDLRTNRHHIKQKGQRS